jgi:Tol biopolymer transport system component
MKVTRIATALISATAAVVLVAAPAPARAELGPLRLVSRSSSEQADAAGSPALSADGRYLAFVATVDGASGVFREEVASGALAPVATGTAFPRGPAADASAPSISADGRYVSFTTKAQLDPADDPQTGTSDVYVADMRTSPPSYRLASAADGSSQSLGGDSTAAPGVALDAAGDEVAFVNGGQVYLRYLASETTLLVSASRDPLNGAMEPGVAVPGGAVLEVSAMPAATGASLSADGTTVAWLGTHLPAQVPLLADERETILTEDASPVPYDEPLWRRVADGSQAPTRRIVGGGDPLAPGCPADGTLANPACQGPFPAIAAKSEAFNLAMGWLGTQGPLDGVPKLSADGRQVVLIGNPTEATNLFLVDMAPGLSRTQALRQLTSQVAVRPEEEGSAANREPYVPLNGHIWDIAVSGDGRRIAFATARQQFPLAPPTLVTPPPSQLGLVEVYLLDLETEALRRVSHGFGGSEEASLGSGTGANGDGAAAPTLDQAGDLLGFASTASNLVEGDGNDASDVFLVADSAAVTSAGPIAISAPPRQRSPKPRRRLGLSAISLPDGNVKLIAMVPGSGKVNASVTAALEVGAHASRVGRAQRRARGGGSVSMIVALPRRYSGLARTREGLYATAHVSFRAERGKPLRGRLQVHFHAHHGRGGRGR